MNKESIPMIISEGNKFQLYKYKSEEELEEMAFQHSRDIFGENTLCLDIKKRITSKKGISCIPDGYLIDLKNNKFYIMEIELSPHEIISHISNQLDRFKLAMNNVETRTQIANDIYDEVLQKKLDKKIDLKYLQETINKKYGIFIIIDDVSEQLTEVVDMLSRDGTEVVTIPFKTYINPEGNYLYWFESFTKEELEKESKKWAFKWTTIPVEKHLGKTSEYMQAIFSELSKEICHLPNVKEKSRQGWVTYQTSPLKNFCTIKILPTHLEIYLKSNNKFNDERGVVKNIKRTPTWAFDKVFTINSQADIKYALELIKQAYECVCENGESKWVK